MTEEESEELTRSNEATRVKAERVRAADNDARVEKKRQKVASGLTPNHLTCCGGYKLIIAEHSNPYNVSYVMDGLPPMSGPYRSPKDPSDLLEWHSQDFSQPQLERHAQGFSLGEFSQLQLFENLEGAAGKHPLEFEVPQNSFHRPVPPGLDPDGTPIRSDPLSTGWCYCSARVAVFYPVGCNLPWCCRASAVLNKGWLDAMARENMIYYCSD